MSDQSSAFFQTGASELGSDRAEIFSRRDEFGGKGAGLHALCAAGYRVPPGFTLSSGFCRSYYDRERSVPEGLSEALSSGLARIEEAVARKLGGGADGLKLAVRSGAAVSMPGMMDTVLGVCSREELESAVLRVFESWSSDRARTYREEQGIIGLEGTAVTVQALCPAEAAGVSFSRAPGQDGADKVLIEAVSGLGEALVSGEVTPDSYLVSREGLELVRERSRGEQLLGSEAIGDLASMTLRLESEFGFPVDVEWAWSQGEFWFLQVREARAQHGGGEGLLEEELERALGLLGDDGMLVRHNLDETLTFPTPMTGDIQSEFMSGRGGFGTLYRELGYQPSSKVERDGFLELVGGRIFADPRRSAGLFYSDGILAYDPAELTARPSAIEEPPGVWNTRDASPPELLRTLVQVWRSSRTAAAGRRDALGIFLRDTLPGYEAWVAGKLGMELGELDKTELFDELEARIERVMGGFAPKVLKLSFYSSLVLDELRDLLERCLGFRRAAVESRALLSALSGDLAIDQAAGLLEAAGSDSALQVFLDRFGHRTGAEMELAEKRWWEEPERVKALAEQMAGGEVDFLSRRRSLAERRDSAEGEVLELLGSEYPAALGRFTELLREARELLPWRENGKFHWMAGYDLIRRVLVELDDRLSLEGNIFYLDREELRECLHAGEPGIPARLGTLIGQRRKLRRGYRGLQLPRVLSSDSLAACHEGGGEKIERPSLEPAAGGLLRGEGISSGSGRGRLWLCSSPAEKPPFEGAYLLVAESTDPDWTPLLAGAAGLVVERGGSLSHGAIVCRDFGVPAVVIEGAGRMLETGSEALLDADRGELRLGDEAGGDLPPDDGTAEPGGWDPGPEPFCAPPPPDTARRVLLGLATAILVSILLVSSEVLSSTMADLAGLALDPLTAGASTPFSSIFSAALLGAVVSLGILAVASDRKKLRLLRARLRWYRRNIAGAKEKGLEAIRGRLAGRLAAAKSDRALVLMKPIAWTFLPLCIGFIWVNDRFGAEPISPGSRFRVTAFLEPSALKAAGRLRFARMDAGDGLRILGAPYRRIEPNAAAAISPYRVAWDVEALPRRGRPDGGPERLAVSVTAAGERVRKEVIVTGGLERAAAVGRYGGGIREVQVDHQALWVELPPWLHSVISRLAALFSGGRGLLPAQTAVGPWTAYLALAVLLVLALQWLSGYR